MPYELRPRIPALIRRGIAETLRDCKTPIAAMAILLMTTSGLAEAKEEFADPSLLISTDQLQEALTDPDIAIIDVRDARNFQQGHIPTAVSFPAGHVVDPSSRIKGARRSDAHLARIFGKLGIGKDAHIVFYDDKGGHLAARFFWIAHYLGHRHVSVLDGGFPEWQKEERPINTDTKLPNREVFPVDAKPRHLATADWILEHMNDSDIVVIDVRNSKMFAKGYIPGAVNIPWKKSLGAEEMWKNPEELRQLFESFGVTKDKNVVVYCQFGNMNAHTYLTLKALGYPRVRSYDRAWAEWGGDPSLSKTAAATQ